MVEEDSPILKPTNMLFKDYPNPLSNLLFTVKDNGDGIPYQKRDEMFEPFVRFHRGPQAGSGLGLSLARGFARFLGGEIDFVDGNLTTFKFKVPLYSFFKAQIFRTMRLVEKYYRRGLITTMVIFAFEEKRGEPFSIDFYKSLEISSYFQQTLYRTTDYVGFGDNKANFLLLLPGTNAKDSIFAINRMLSVLKGVSGLPSETLLRVGLCEYSPLFKTFKDFLGTARSNEYYYEKLSDLGSSP